MANKFIVFCFLLTSGYGQQKAPAPAAAEPAKTSSTRELLFYYNDMPAAKPAPAKPLAKKSAPKSKGAETAPEPPTGPNVPLLNVSAGDEVFRRMGLKYRIQLSAADCGSTPRDVSSSYLFKNGDRIRLEVESNVDGYLYVILRGSSGKEMFLFPDRRINDGDNFLPKHVPFPVPAGTWFEFDEKPGDERLTVIVSREPMQKPSKSLATDERPMIAGLRNTVKQTVLTRDLQLISQDGPKLGNLGPLTQSTFVLNMNGETNRNKMVTADLVLKHK